MRTDYTPEGEIRYIYDSEGEYNSHRLQLDRTHGRRQLVYEGWLNGELIRIMRR